MLRKVNNHYPTEINLTTEMQITEKNGHRRYGPPIDSVTQPPKGSEVLVGNLPKDCMEKEIEHVFQKVGKIFMIRIKLDIGGRGTNRGFCFVQYHSPAEAARAVRELHRVEIRRGRNITVSKSVDSYRLFFGFLPRNKSQREIIEEITRVTEGVEQVISYPCKKKQSLNRGFAFVDYVSYKAAATALWKMSIGKSQMWGADVIVEWAESDTQDVKALYVQNLLLSTSTETLNSIFNLASNNGVEKLIKISKYAFVHFSTREMAQHVKDQLDGTEIDGSGKVEIQWAIPEIECNAHKQSVHGPGQSSVSSSQINNPLNQTGNRYNNKKNKGKKSRQRHNFFRQNRSAHAHAQPAYTHAQPAYTHAQPLPAMQYQGLDDFPHQSGNADARVTGFFVPSTPATFPPGGMYSYYSMPSISPLTFPLFWCLGRPSGFFMPSMDRSAPQDSNNNLSESFIQELD